MSFQNVLKNMVSNKDSISHSLRRKRFEIFKKFFKSVIAKKNSISMLDVGGTISFWERMEFVNEKKVKITLLNLGKQENNSGQNITCIVGDGCSMGSIKDQEFDVVFSNSVIEHVGTFEKQRQMANEIQRVGTSYFIQTPNYWFPFEPHFLMIGFQYLPVRIRAFLIRRFSLGWFDRITDYDESVKVASHIRLLKKRELGKLFPGATIIREKFLGLTKSFIVYKY